MLYAKGALKGVVGDFVGEGLYFEVGELFSVLEEAGGLEMSLVPVVPPTWSKFPTVPSHL